MHFMKDQHTGSGTSCGTVLGLSKGLLYDDVFCCNMNITDQLWRDLLKVLQNVKNMKAYMDAFWTLKYGANDNRVQPAIDACQKAITELIYMCSESDDVNPLRRCVSTAGPAKG